MASENEALLAGARTHRALNGVLFLGGLELGYNVYGGTNSSPQTTELFAGERASTLMKWVSIAGLKCIAYGLLASLISRSYWPLVGIGLSAGLMHSMYVHAERAGRAQAPPSNADPTSAQGGRPRRSYH